MKTIKEVDQRSSNSSSYASNSHRQEPEKTRKVLTSKISPFNFSLDYDDFCLHLKWDFKMVEAKSNASFRHILIVDFDSFSNLFEIQTLIKNYCQMLRLGDFLRVVDLKGHRQLQWKQRLNNPIDISGLSKYKSRGFDVLNKTLEDISSFTQQICIVFILNKDVPSDSEIFTGISQALSRGEFIGYISVVAHQSCRDFLSSPPSFPIQNLQLIFNNEAQLYTKVKSLFQEYAKLRARRLNIVLKCLNGYMEIHKTAETEWMRVDRLLMRTKNNLNNYTDYVEKIQLVCPTLNRVAFSVQLTVELCNGDTFMIDQDFSIDTSKKLLSVRELPKQRKAKVVGDSLYSTELGYDPFRMEMHMERVTVLGIKEDFSAIE